MREVFLVGVGATGFGRTDRTREELAREAIAAAMADAGLGSEEVAAVVVAVGRGAGAGNGGPALGPRCGRAGHVGRPSAWAGRALQLGWQAVAGGEHDVVLCVGTERPAAGHVRERPLRAQARAARRYMTASGATLGHFARVAVKNRGQGAENPRAMLGGRVDETAVLDSDMLAWPLRRLMVAPLADGAAAVILAASDVRADAASDGRRSPRVRASVLLAGSDADGATARAAMLAYQAAGLGPEEIDCAEVDDHTAAGEVAAYEALQFVPEGQGPELVDSGFTAVGGVLPVNPSGGLLSQGDAVGASSIAQVCELAWQLRGEAGARQVAGARVGLALSGFALGGGLPLVSLMIVSVG